MGIQRKTTYLEMTSSDQLKPAEQPLGIIIIESEIKEFRFNRYLYQLVGESVNWHERLTWSDQEWRAYAQADNLRTFVSYHRGSISGYFELQRIDQDTVDIVNIGLAPSYIGKGYGGSLLTQAIEQAWLWGRPKRVVSEIRPDDHKSALTMMLDRGMTVYNG